MKLPFRLTVRDFVISLVFTIVEIATLTLWIDLFGLGLQNKLAAGIVLSAGLYIEHVISRIK